MNNIYHIHNKGGRVFYRSEADYVTINNKIAVAACRSGASILLLSIMSNHVHILVEAADEEQLKHFCRLVVQTYAYGYISKYGFSMARKMRLKYRIINNSVDLLNCSLYILKNPLHHNVVGNVFEYKYGSAGYLFGEELSKCITGGRIENLYRNCGKLSSDERREISRSIPLPKEWLINQDGMAMPMSYINIRRTRSIWKNNIKTFLYDMNKGIAEDHFIFARDDDQDLSFNTYNDIQVCTIIDDYARDKGLRSFHFLSDDDKRYLVKKLLSLRCPKAQIARCIWLTPDEVSIFAKR